MGLLCLESEFPSLQMTLVKGETALPGAQENSFINCVLCGCSRVKFEPTNISGFHTVSACLSYALKC